jgi:hypothetical protein
LFAGTILFGHIVTFGAACGPSKPGFRADANSVLTLPEGFEFFKTEQYNVRLWAKDDVNTSIALNFQVGASIRWGKDACVCIRDEGTMSEYGLRTMSIQRLPSIFRWVLDGGKTHAWACIRV